MFTRILVPTDFSAGSDAALDYARAMAVRFQARLVVLHVVDDPFVTGPFGSTSVSPPQGYRAALVADAGRRLSLFVQDLERDGLTVATAVVVGPTATTIVREASGCGATLIVMGTHGRSGLAHLLLGSVAERVVRTAGCPVLTVRERAARGDAKETVAGLSPIPVL